MTSSDRAALVLIPGLACDGEVWSDTIADIADLAELADCHVADITQALSIADMAEAVLASAPDRFALAGHSLGGYVSFEILRRAPERVTRLALIGTSARPDTPTVAARRRKMIERAESGEYDPVIEGLLPAVIARQRQNDEELVERVRSMMQRVGSESFCQQQRAVIDRADSRPDLLKIKVPTLVAAGDEDALMPSEVHKEMVERIPNAQRATIEACGHTTPLERPQDLAALLREWLADGAS